MQNDKSMAIKFELLNQQATFTEFDCRVGRIIYALLTCSAKYDIYRGLEFKSGVTFEPLNRFLSYPTAKKHP